MGTLYQSAVGNPPVCTSLRFKKWCEELLAYRLAECPVDRATKYYFAQNGNDTTGNGTIGSPWRTIARANTLIGTLPSNANAALLFRRGDKWSEATTLSVAKNNITIGAYGTGAKPQFTRFVAIPRGSWSATAGRTEVWQFALTTQPSAVRMVDDVTVGFVQCQNLNDVESTIGSWWWDSANNLLYMRPHRMNVAASNQLTTSDFVYYEYCVHNATRGISATGDNIRIDNIRIDGAGCQANPNNNSNYSIWWGPATPTDSCVVSNCEAYYSEAHNIGTTTSGSGGILTIHNCTMAWMSSTNSTGGIGAQTGTLSVSYAAEGQNEIILSANRYLSAQLPGKSVNYDTLISGASGYAHASGGANRIALGLSLNEIVEPSMYQCAALSTFGDAPSFSDFSDCRAWTVKGKLNTRGWMQQDSGRAFVMLGTQPFPATVGNNFAFINCDYYARAVEDTSNGAVGRSAMANLGSGGIIVNGSITVDWAGSMPTAQISRWINTSAAASTRIYNSQITMKTYGPCSASISNRFSNSLIVIKNSVIFADGKAGLKSRNMVGVNNNANFLSNNSYYLVNDQDLTGVGIAGFSNDPFASHFPGDFPDAVPELTTANQQLVEGYPLEYDMNWTPRMIDATARGPIEAFDTQAIRYGDNVVNVKIQNHYPTVTRQVADERPITFSWPASNATITATRSIDDGTFAAASGAVAFSRTSDGLHLYTIAYDEDDRPEAAGKVLYRLTDGSETRLLPVSVVSVRTIEQDATADQTLLSVATASATFLDALTEIDDDQLRLTAKAVELAGGDATLAKQNEILDAIQDQSSRPIAITIPAIEYDSLIADEGKITRYRGTAWIIAVEGLLTIPTKCFFTMKRDAETDAQAAIQIVKSNPADDANDGLKILSGAVAQNRADGAIAFTSYTVSGQTRYRATMTINAEATAGFKVRDYRFDFKDVAADLVLAERELRVVAPVTAATT